MSADELDLDARLLRTIGRLAPCFDARGPTQVLDPAGRLVAAGFAGVAQTALVERRRGAQAAVHFAGLPLESAAMQALVRLVQERNERNERGEAGEPDPPLPVLLRRAEAEAGWA